MTDTDATSAFESIAMRVHPGAMYVRHWPLTGGVSAQIEALEISKYQPFLLKSSYQYSNIP